MSTMKETMQQMKGQSSREILHLKKGGTGKPKNKWQYRPKVMLQAFNKAHLSVLDFN